MDFISRCKRIGSTLIIPEGVFFIPNRAFSMDETIEKVIIGKDVLYIDDMAFSFCINIKEVIFESYSVCRTLGIGCFMFCKSLKYINLPISLKRIKSMAFLFNEDLKKIIIPETVKELHSNIFCYSGVEKIVFESNNIPIIKYDVFNGMFNIKNVFICKKKYNVLLCEGLIIEVKDKIKKVNNIYIQRGRNITNKLNKSNIEDLWWVCYDESKTMCVFGKNMRDVYNELRYKLNNNIAEIAVRENWTMDTKISLEQYSLISGNCWHNIKIFMNEFGYPEDEKLSFREIIELSRLQRNFIVFEDFINKYIIKDDGTRNGVKVEVKEKINE